ncbi:MAG: response regulator [Gammaproteobacteria bacterium]|nr:response regulator [Gammaproteobacteria bacterium]
MTKPILLIVDDEPDMGEFATFAGEITGYEVVTMSSGKDFQEAYLLMSPDLLLMDVAIPDIDAIGLLEWLGAAGNRAPIILMSGHGDYMLNWAKTVGTDLGMSVIDTLSKPIALEDLEKALSEVKVKLAK